MVIHELDVSTGNKIASLLNYCSLILLTKLYPSRLSRKQFQLLPRSTSSLASERCGVKCRSVFFIVCPIPTSLLVCADVWVTCSSTRHIGLITTTSATLRPSVHPFCAPCRRMFLFISPCSWLLLNLSRFLYIYLYLWPCIFELRFNTPRRLTIGL